MICEGLLRFPARRVVGVARFAGALQKYCHFLSGLFIATFLGDLHALLPCRYGLAWRIVGQQRVAKLFPCGRVMGILLNGCPKIGSGFAGVVGFHIFVAQGKTQ